MCLQIFFIQASLIGMGTTCNTQADSLIKQIHISNEMLLHKLWERCPKFTFSLSAPSSQAYSDALTTPVDLQAVY